MDDILTPGGTRVLSTGYVENARPVLATRVSPVQSTYSRIDSITTANDGGGAKYSPVWGIGVVIVVVIIIIIVIMWAMAEAIRGNKVICDDDSAVVAGDCVNIHTKNNRGCGVLGCVITVIVIVLIIAAIIWFVRASPNYRGGAARALFESRD